jgi:cytochrome c553
MDAAGGGLEDDVRTPLLLLIVSLTVGSIASAQAPAPALGRSLAATCANCHGTGGVSAGEVPSLAGASKEDIVRKMKEFKSGARPATIMHQLAKGYTDEQIETLAAWFASQKPAR